MFSQKKSFRGDVQLSSVSSSSSSSHSPNAFSNFAFENGCCFFIQVNKTQPFCFEKKKSVNHRQFLYLLNQSSFACDVFEIVCFYFLKPFLIL